MKVIVGVDTDRKLLSVMDIATEDIQDLPVDALQQDACSAATSKDLPEFIGVYGNEHVRVIGVYSLKKIVQDAMVFGLDAMYNCTMDDAHEFLEFNWTKDSGIPYSFWVKVDGSAFSEDLTIVFENYVESVEHDLLARFNTIQEGIAELQTLGPVTEGEASDDMTADVSEGCEPDSDTAEDTVSEDDSFDKLIDYINTTLVEVQAFKDSHRAMCESAEEQIQEIQHRMEEGKKAYEGSEAVSLFGDRPVHPKPVAKVSKTGFSFDTPQIIRAEQGETGHEPDTHTTKSNEEEQEPMGTKTTTKAKKAKGTTTNIKTDTAVVSGNTASNACVEQACDNCGCCTGMLDKPEQVAVRGTELIHGHVEKLRDKLNVHVEFPENTSEADAADYLKLTAAADDFVYFCGERVALHIGGDVAQNFEVKDRILEVLSAIPFTTADGQAVNVLKECTGEDRKLAIYAPFSPELDCNENMVHIYINGFAE